MAVQQNNRPDFYETLCDVDLDGSSSKKRCNRAVNSTLTYLDKCIAIHNETPVSVYLGKSMGGLEWLTVWQHQFFPKILDGNSESWYINCGCIYPNFLCTFLGAVHHLHIIINNKCMYIIKHNIKINTNIIRSLTW